MRINDENNVIYVCKELYNLRGVPVLYVTFDLLKEVVDSDTEVCAEDSSGKAFALKDTLSYFELSQRGV